MLESFLPQKCNEFPGKMQSLAQLIVGGRGQNRVSLFVGKPVRTSNNTVCKPGAFCGPAFVEMNEYCMREPIDARIETANTVAQSLRQHWNHAVREINAVSAPTRFSIQRAVRLHVSCDISNVYAQAPAASDPLDMNRIVEIARVVGIDGNDELLA